MKVTKHQAVQVHPVPSHITDPVGPFPRELFKEPEIIDDYEPQLAEDGAGFALGSTAQNNFRPVKHLRCSNCLARVPETETQNHICEE